jgi:hypothetical protein
MAVKSDVIKSTGIVSDGVIGYPTGGAPSAGGGPSIIVDGITTGAWLLDATYLKQLSNGTVDVASAGDPIGYAEDLTGNGYHLTNANSINKFIYDDSTFTTGSGEVSTTRDKGLATDSTTMGLNTDTDFSICVGFKTAATFPGSSQQIVMGYGLGSSINLNEKFAVTIQSDGRLGLFAYDSAVGNLAYSLFSAGAVQTSTAYVLTLTYDSGTRDFKARLNGVAGTTANYPAGRTITADFYFGLSSVASTTSGNSMEVGSRFSACGVYSAVLSGDNLSSVESAIAARIGVTL